MTFILEIKPEVEALFLQHNPKSGVLLRRYVNCLSRLLFESARYQSPYERSVGLYQLSSFELERNGGKLNINGKYIYVDKWLSDHGIPLYEVKEKGSNFSGKKSLIVLTDNVILIDTFDDTTPLKYRDSTIELIKEIGEDVLPRSDLKPYELDEMIDNDFTGLLNYLYSDIVKFNDKNKPTFEQLDAFIDEHFDRLKVDIKSCEAYLHWLLNDSKMSKEKKTTSARNARIILAVAKQNRLIVNGNESKYGEFLQKKAPSEFGRTYYSGISIQSVNKELRRAILGDHHQYDMNSCAFNWKLMYGRELSMKHGYHLYELFPCTINYIKDKKAFQQSIMEDLKEAGCELSDDFIISLIKQAMTAISFGAKLTKGSGWVDNNGTFQVNAIADIFKQKEIHSSFVNHPLIEGFVLEQQFMDNYIIEKELSNNPQLKDMKCVRTEKGRLSNSKLLAYLYQHFETELMDVFRAAIKHYRPNVEVLANIHDAVITKQGLGTFGIQDIEVEIQNFIKQKFDPKFRMDHPGIKFFGFKQDIIGGYTPKMSEDELEDLRGYAEFRHKEDLRSKQYAKDKLEYLAKNGNDIGLSEIPEPKIMTREEVEQSFKLERYSNIKSSATIAEENSIIEQLKNLEKKMRGAV